MCAVFKQLAQAGTETTRTLDTSPSPEPVEPAELGTVEHWKRVRSAARGPQCSLASLRGTQEPGTLEGAIFEYCCSLEESKVKQSLLALLIVDRDEPTPRRLRAVLEAIDDFPSAPEDDRFSEYFGGLVKGITNTSVTTASPQDRLKAACTATMEAMQTDSNDDCAYMRKRASWAMDA